MEEYLAMNTLKVIVADNFHYQDEDANYLLGTFTYLELAMAACRKIVDEYLTSVFEEGMSAATLYGSYTGFGEDPYIVGDDCDEVSFSTWTYVESQCEIMCAAPRRTAITA